LAGAVVIALASGSAWVTVVVASVAAFGLVQGALNPAVSSMIGMETPSEVQATVFGFMSTAFAAGITAGPLLAGLIAGTWDATTALRVSAGLGCLLFGLVLFFVREPSREVA